MNYILIGCPWLKGCLIISVPRTCYIHVGVCFIKVPMYSIMQSHYFKHFHWKLLSKNCQNKGMKSFDADDSPLEQTLLTLPVWSKNWRNKEDKNLSQEGHSSIVVMKRWGGLREASKKIPDDDEFCAKTKSQEGFIKYSTGFKALNNLAPPYLSQLIVPYNPTRNLRSASKHLLEVPSVRLKSYGDRAFSVAAPKHWNDIPLDIKLSGSVDVFKSRLKTYLFRLAFSWLFVLVLLLVIFFFDCKAI